MATVIQAYRFALDPTPRQRRALASHCGAARYAYNWGLRLVQERLDQRRLGEDIEVPWTLPSLRWEWNRAKHEVAPWWAENSKEAYSSGLDGLARALKNFSDSEAGRRKSRRMGFPRPKRKGRGRDACRFTTGQIKVLDDRKHVQLPRIGVIRTHESTRKLARRLEHGTAVSWPPPSLGPRIGGSSPSPSRLNAMSRADAPRRPWSAWTPESGTLRCCPPAW
jgi:putative transposase